MPWKACAAWGGALALALAGHAAARPFTVADLLSQESIGASAIDPQDRWAVFERSGSYAAGPRFDLGQRNPLAAGRLFVAPLDGDGPATPWLKPDPGPGQVLGGFSPSGDRAAVFQLQGDRWRLGVTATASGETRWLDLAPEWLWTGRQLAWLSDHELLVLARSTPGLPVRLRETRQSAERLPALWAKTARGDLARTVLGSGRYLAVRERPAARRLVRVDVRTGEAWTVAEGEITDFEVAPGSRTVALREAGEDLQGRLGRSMHGDWGLAEQVERLVLIDLKTGRRIAPCQTCDVLASLLSWAPDGRAILVYARAVDTPWSSGALWAFGASGQGRRLTPPTLRLEMRLRPESVQAGWMGDRPVALARAPAGARPVWYRLDGAAPRALGRRLAEAGDLVAADAEGLTVLAQARLWRLDPDGGARRLGPDLPLKPLRQLTGRDGRLNRLWTARGWALASIGERTRVLSLRGDAVEDLASAPAGATPLAAGGAGVLFQSGTPSGVLTVGYGGEGEAKGVRPLATLNAGLAEADPLDVRPVHHRGPEGQPLRSWLFLPPRAPGAPPPPLLVKVYSGDVHRDWPRPKPPVLGLVADVRVLVGQGYAVLTPSLPLPERQPQEPAAGLAQRILAIVEAARQAPETADRFDAERLALIGHSYGGYTVAAVLTQTDRFRAAVAQSGYMDLVAEWANLSVAQRVRPDPGGRSNAATGGIETAQGRMGVPPWADPARYARNSPLLAADRITTPLLLLHGDQDGNVALRQSEALFSALYRQGKDAMLVTYWGEGHIIASPGNVRDLYARMFAFLDAQLRVSAGAPSASREPAPASSAPRPRSPPP